MRITHGGPYPCSQTWISCVQAFFRHEWTDMDPYLHPRLLGNIRDSDPGSGAIHMAILCAHNKIQPRQFFLWLIGIL
jgi:hypothetical protein